MTGVWTGEPPEEGPAMPLTNRLLSGSRGHRQPFGVVAAAMARAAADEAREERERAAAAVDPDEIAAGYVARGYSPGMITELSQKLGDTQAELAAERDRVEAGRRGPSGPCANTPPGASR